jgi:ribosome-associated protein
MTETTAKKDVQKLQRAIIDGLEDVKAQDIVVFNTEHLSALFERVVIASGTSNRQTKALAASVRDKVRDAGFAKPRIEGEENGEWIIIDCGQAVVHVMQPAIRQYYHLEEIWGEKPVRLKLGAPKPTPSAAKTKATTGTSATGGKASQSSSRGSAAKPAKAGTRTAAKSASKPATKSSAKPASAARKPASQRAAGSSTGSKSSASAKPARGAASRSTGAGAASRARKSPSA